jgi:hypothetical protein
MDNIFREQLEKRQKLIESGGFNLSSSGGSFGDSNSAEGRKRKRERMQRKLNSQRVAKITKISAANKPADPNAIKLQNQPSFQERQEQALQIAQSNARLHATNNSVREYGTGRFLIDRRRAG